MSIDVNIIGSGKGASVFVSNERALCVEPTGLPPIEQDGIGIVFRQYLTDTGASTGDNDMKVDGSTTTQSFSVNASLTEDIYITSLSFVIADASATLNKFGNLTALTNGCDLVIGTADGEITIADALQTNFDFIRLCQGNPSFGDGAAAFRASNVSGTSEGYIPVLDFKAVFGLQWGLRIRKGTEDKITLRIKDNVTGVDAFNCIAYGFKRKTL